MSTTVLLVEDDPEQALLFARVLEMVGYRVTTAVNAADAQRRMVDSAYALLLVDWDLGSGMQGDALILQAKAEHPGVKTILFSNHPEVEAKAAASGADGWMRKIDGISKLRRLVAHLVSPE